MFTPKTVVALSLVALAGVAPAAAQRPNPLGSLVDEALRKNLGIAAERIAVQRASSDVAAARGLAMPALTLSTRLTQMDGVPNVGTLVNPAYAALNRLTGTNAFPTNLNITLPQRYESVLRLTQPLFNDAIGAGVAVARARYDVQQMRLAAAARQLAADVQIAYLENAMARRVAEIYAASLALVQENERAAQRLVSAGRATPEVVSRARAERLGIEQQLAEAQADLLATSRALNRLLQRPLDTPVPEIPDTAFDLPLDVTEDGAVSRALAAREELRQADAGVRTAKAGERAARAAFLPQLAVQVDYGYQGPEATLAPSRSYWTASAVVSWSLFNGGGDAARRAAASADASEAATRRSDLADRIALDVRDAYQAAVTARAAIATARARLDAAQRTFELVRRGYEEGVASHVEFVDARTAYTNADINVVLTAYRYAIRWVVLERVAALRDFTR